MSYLYLALGWIVVSVLVAAFLCRLFAARKRQEEDLRSSRPHWTPGD